MDRERFAEAVSRVEEIDRVVRKLDPAVRGQAFSALAGDALAPTGAGLDIEELVQLVLSLAAQEAENDLREILEEVEKVNEQKKRLRELVDRLGRESDDVATRLRSEYGDLLGGSDQGELQMLQLQMKVDRLSRLLETLSNILKKMRDTESTIIGNIK